MSKINPISGQGLTIVGAGLAGMIAAHAWPQATIVESAPKGAVREHKALLRFRSDEIAKLTGTEFKKVLVRKGLWSEGKAVAPSIDLSNKYAQKVLRKTAIPGDRSVWNLAAAERFVAPEDFAEQLREALSDRITYGAPADFAAHSESWREGAGGPLISTAPMHIAMAALGVPAPTAPPSGFQQNNFEHARVVVDRWTLPGAQLYQTIYFPDLDTPVYRASFTGDTLIVESAEVSPLGNAQYDLKDVLLAFGFIQAQLHDLESLGRVEQRYGKIQPLDERTRKRILFTLTHEHGVYSLGRFATWRNILLDDLLDDIAVVKRLLMTESPYEARRLLS